MNRLEMLPRTTEGDLLAAFILSGAEMFMSIEQIERVASKLTTADPANAQRLSGVLMRGDDMPDDLEKWIRANRDHKE